MPKRADKITNVNGFVKSCKEINLDYYLEKLRKAETTTNFVNASIEPFTFHNLRGDKVKVTLCKYMPRVILFKDINKTLQGFYDFYNPLVVNSILNHWYQPCIFKYVPPEKDSDTIEVHIAMNAMLTQSWTCASFMLLFCIAHIWKDDLDYDQYDYDDKIITEVTAASYVFDMGYHYKCEILKDLYNKHFETILFRADRDYEVSKTLYKIVKTKVNKKKREVMPVIRKRIKLLKSIHSKYYKNILIEEILKEK